MITFLRQEWPAILFYIGLPLFGVVIVIVEIG